MFEPGILKKPHSSGVAIDIRLEMPIIEHMFWTLTPTHTVLSITPAAEVHSFLFVLGLRETRATQRTFRLLSVLPFTVHAKPTSDRDLLQGIKGERHE